jgi:hypothetical protein
VEGRYVKVLIHPELQMEPDAEMDWRVLQYNAGLLLQEAEPGTRVLTIVFWHCPGGGIQKRRCSLEFYDEEVHGVTYWSVGLGDLEAETYAQSVNPMAWALASWMRQPRQGRPIMRLRLQERILKLVRDDWNRGLLLDTVRTYFRLSPRERAEEERLLQSTSHNEVIEMLQTELGRMRHQERLETIRQSILEVVRARFQDAPESIEARVRRIRSLDRLQEWLRRAAVANSVEELERLLT